MHSVFSTAPFASIPDLQLTSEEELGRGLQSLKTMHLFLSSTRLTTIRPPGLALGGERACQHAEGVSFGSRLASIMSP